MKEQNKDIDQLKVFFNNYSSRFSGIYVEDENPRSWFDSIIDKYFRQTVYQRYANTVSHLENPELNTVLDIGCGPGHYVMSALKLGKKVTALDIASKMLDLTKARVDESEFGASVDYLLADYMEHTFQNKFDATIVMGFFDYVADPVPFIKKLLADTSKEIYISVPKNDGWQAFQRKIRYWINKCPLYLFSLDQLKSILTDSECLSESEIIPMKDGWFVVIRPGATH
jgi:cyclopropane fatty-acyl-phospholipid synthase-like methyltransferase